MSNPFDVVRQFEQALCEFTGAPYCVTTTSCTMALLLAVAWHLRPHPSGHKIVTFLRELSMPEIEDYSRRYGNKQVVEIPSRTYIGVPMSILHAGGIPVFRDEEWRGSYQLKPLPVWDSARYFTSGMYHGITHGGHVRDGTGQMACLSFHWSKILGIQQGGAILHDDPKADKWLRMARFDGRTEGVDPRIDLPTVLGFHAYMSPEIAAEGLVRLSLLPKHNESLPNSDYPDLSQMDIFK